MWDSRLFVGILVSLQLCIQSADVKFLATGDIDSFVREEKSSLIAYTGIFNCPQAAQYIDQLKIAQDELNANGLSVKVGIANESSALPFYQKYGPYSVLNVADKEPVRIDCFSDGVELAHFVQKKIQFASFYELKNKAEYDFFIQSARTIFAAYLIEHDKIEDFKKVAYQYNSMFLLTTDEKVAETILNTTTSKAIVTHNWYEKQVNYMDGYTFNRQSFQNFVDEELSKTKEMQAHTASLAFSTKSSSIAILFVPSSARNRDSLIKSFADLSADKKKLDSYYVESDNSDNMPILEEFGVERSSTIIVYLREFRRLSQIPFTKQCSGSVALKQVMQKFLNTDGTMFSNYERFI